MQAILSELRAEGIALTDQVETLIKNLQALPSEIREAAVAGFLTIEETVLRAAQVESLTKALVQEGDEKFALVPFLRLTQLRDRLKSFRSYIAQVNSQFDQIASWGGFARFESSNFHVYAKNGNAVDLGGNVRNLASQTEQVLDGYFDVAPIARAKPILRFGTAARIVQESAEEATGITANLKATLVAASNHLKQVELDRNTASSGSSEVSRLLEEAEKSRRTVEENEQKAATAAAKITSVLSDVEALEFQVSEYESNFKAFQAALEQREKNFREGNDTLSTLTEKLKKKDADVDDLITKAKEMLGGATVSGLSHAYREQFEAIGRQLNGAKFGFYAAVGFLLFSVIVAFNLTQISEALHQSIGLPAKRDVAQVSSPPQAATETIAKVAGVQNISTPATSKQQNASAQTAITVATPLASTTQAEVPQPKPTDESKDRSSLLDRDGTTGVAAIQAFSNLASRFLVILPGLLLIGFAARRHAALFNLREQYSHKWAIAASVEGFKTQAPNYKEPIAAAVFTELLANPAQTIDQQFNRRKNGFIDRLIKPVVDRTLERMGVIPEKEGATDS